ncbi:hypothetical protein [Streptomyces sp. NPDC058279]|uniref:hypothetical protein n=1 Tax=Streptomyces sp. NPDC058279 TaxID=3346418 RepID=UPI0036E9717F
MRARVSTVVLTIGGAVLLVGCSGGPEAAASGPSRSPGPSASRTGTPTPIPTPTAAPEPTPAGVLVLLWYGQGGSEQYNELVRQARLYWSMHEHDRAVIDFKNLSEALRTADRRGGRRPGGGRTSTRASPS